MTRAITNLIWRLCWNADGGAVRGRAGGHHLKCVAACRYLCYDLLVLLVPQFMVHQSAQSPHACLYPCSCRSVEDHHHSRVTIGGKGSLGARQKGW